VEAKDFLKHLNVWRVVDSSEIVPQPPAAVASGSTTPTAPDPLDPKYNFQPQSTDSIYLMRFDNFLQDWRSYRNSYEKANGTICSLLEPSIWSRYTDDKFDDPKVLWDTIKSDFEKVVKLEERHGMAKLIECKLELYPSVSEWITAQEKLINDLAICGIKVDDEWRKFCILSNVPNTNEWRNYASALELTDKADTVASIITHLLSFEASLRRSKCLDPDAALFVSMKGRGRGQQDQKGGLVRYGCGERGHKKMNCPKEDEWAPYSEKKSKTPGDASLTSVASISAADYETFLF
jgi:hypothetical protein